jgi:dienelactone hydrolase
VGSFYAPTDRSAPAIVLVHQLGSTRAEWQPYLQALRADKDYALLTIDLRGHGESVHQKDGKKLDWQRFGEADWHKLSHDVHAAVDWLRARKDIAPRSVGAAGASIGASALILYAAPTVAVHAVALLSPGLDYHGLHIRNAVARFGHRPLLLQAAEGDLQSAPAVRTFERFDANHRTVKLYPGRAHGVVLASEHPDSLVAFVQFFRDSL